MMCLRTCIDTLNPLEYTPTYKIRGRLRWLGSCLFNNHHLSEERSVRRSQHSL